MTTKFTITPPQGEKFVTTDSYQQIDGSKAFHQPPRNMSIELLAPTNQQEIPTELTVRQLGLYRNTTYTKGDGYTGWLFSERGADGHNSIGMVVRRFLEGDNQEILNYIHAYITADGIPCSYTKIPPAVCVGEEITTAGWFRLPTCIVRTVIETYSNGTNWYRVWNDGWIEQGGYISSTAVGDSYVTINLWRPFSNTKYFVMNQHEQTAYTNNWGSGCASIHTSNKKTTSFELSVDGCTNTSGYYWMACGL